jgi:predicted permease
MTFIHDLRVAVRRLAHAPGFTFASIAMLALGIGISVAMYCTLDGVLLRGLPFPHSDRIVLVSAEDRAQGIADAQMNTMEAERLAAGTPGFDALAYYWWSGVTVIADGRAREITTHMVGTGYFATLGVEPLLGRALRDDDVREDRAVAVLSHAEWLRHFGGDARVIGRRLDLVDEAPLEVVGVMPASMEVFSGDAGLWRPLSTRLLPSDAAQRRHRALFMLGRLGDGVSVAQADAALAAQFDALREQDSTDRAGWSARAKSLLDTLVGDARAALWGAFALAVLVLLIAASNVAILLDARQTARRHEQAVVLALGASHRRVRQGLLLELALLTGIASALGVLIAYAGIEWLRELARNSIPRVDGIAMDWRVVGFAVLIGVLVPLVATLAGALRVHAVAAEAIRAGGRGMIGSRGSKRVLPAMAMGLSTVSLVAALTLAGGLWRLQQVDPGFHADRVEVLQFFRGGNEAFIPFTVQMLERLRAIPGVRDAALTSAPPLSGIGSASIDVAVVGRAEGESVQAGLRRVSSGYRALLGTRLLAGRDFDDGDRRGAEAVAILNASAARRAFADASPLGQVISLPIGGGERVACRVVGVVDDILNEGLRAAPAPEVLVPFAQQPRNAMSFLVRSDTGGGVAAQMADVLHTLDPRQAITRQYALAEPLVEELRPARFFAGTVAAFAAVALLLAVLGAYAVASLQQRGRIGEYGLRLAVGARPHRLAMHVLRDSLATSAIGIGIGAIGVVMVLRALDLGVVGVATGFALTPLVVGSAAMVLAALVAAVLPALRAARVAPMQALRGE